MHNLDNKNTTFCIIPLPNPKNVLLIILRVRAKITWQISRSYLGEIWSIRLSKTAGIAGYFEDFANEYRPK
ncbi:MAG: hypothetical protein KAJ90_02155, partial [Desulfobacterales bacterium]|nr:hypothetical protein [Desulfobacterales bacterium]